MDCKTKLRFWHCHSIPFEKAISCIYLDLIVVTVVSVAFLNAELYFAIHKKPVYKQSSIGHPKL